jgi:hypothetical protein
MDPTAHVTAMILKTGKLSLCLANFALRHEDVWGTGCIDLHFLDLGTSWRWSASRLGRFAPGEKTTGTHWIGGSVDPGVGLEDVEKRKFLTLPGRCSVQVHRARSTYNEQFQCGVTTSLATN